MNFYKLLFKAVAGARSDSGHPGGGVLPHKSDGMLIGNFWRTPKVPISCFMGVSQIHPHT